jgi:hypothetical protein
MSPKSRPLTPHQRQAAALIGRGFQKRVAAREVGVHSRTISNWMRRDDFRALIAQTREAAVAEVPTAQVTLEAALTATTSSGAPDWRTRVSAARALIGADGPAVSEPPRETIIHTGNLDDGDGDAD